MNDNDIILLYFDRNERAITETDLKYGRYCRKIAWNILENHEDSEECVNDAWMDTWNAIPPEHPFSLKAFVGRLTRNRALNRYDWNHAARRGSGETALCLDELADCVSGADDLTEKEDMEHLVTCINQFLSSIKKEQRIMFVQRYWYECSIEEIAKNIGAGESKVKVTLSRLRKKLKEYLEKEGVIL